MPTTYPLGDTPSSKETGGAPVNDRIVLQSLGVGANRFRAVPTGEKRAPKKGEWYLSGAEITVYRAPNDLSTVFHIARLVEVKVVPSSYEIVCRC